ncbi:hypothetical protein [Planktotalea sp.]|uniref:hypothetical protein n=1 Tax=Planktotalea sp. TaxID=2029877 RepID=UPI003D6AA380
MSNVDQRAGSSGIDNRLAEVSQGSIVWNKTVYGLWVQSTLDLPELLPMRENLSDYANAPSAPSSPDIVIQRGFVPEQFGPNPFIGAESNRLWLSIPNTVRMMIENGTHLTYAPAPGVPDDALRLFILGSGLGALLVQRGYLVIHGNAVVHPSGSGALICVGPSGAGKSTTAVALMQRGLHVLSDDVCPVDSAGRVHPGMARAKLWQDAAAALDIDTEPLARVRAQDAKFNLPLGTLHATSPQPIRAMFCLETAETDHVSTARVSGMERFVAMRRALYRPEYLRALGLEAGSLERLAALAKDIPIYRVTRPKTGFTIAPLLDALLDNA